MGANSIYQKSGSIMWLGSRDRNLKFLEIINHLSHFDESYLDVDNVEWSRMTISWLNDTDTTSVTSAGEHAQVTSVEFDVISDVAWFDVDDDSVVNFDVGIRVSNSTSIVGNNKWDSLNTSLLTTLSNDES